MKLVVLFFVLLVLGLGPCTVKAQTPIVSQNILTPTVGAWTGSVAGQNGGYSGGGNGPAFNADTNTLIFGYATATATQRIAAEAFAIQHALDLSNSGIKISGYNYSWQINNSGQQTGTLAGKVELMRGNTALETYNYNYNATTNGFELKTGTQNFTNEYSLLAGDAMRLSFTGKDNRYWAGYYGPQVRDPSLTLNYTTDPCLANPLYSPSCSGYNQVLNSQNFVGNAYGVQSYAINQALSLSGSGVQINGFNYGYDLYVGGDWCYFGFIICFDTRQSSMAVDVNVTSATGTSLYSATHNHTQQNTFGSYSYGYVFPTKQPLSSMGNFSLSPRQFGTGALYSSWSNWQYTPDPCVADPLSSTSCSGYAAAYQAQMCAATPLYSPACPGYAAAVFAQQCSANALSDPSCPGYASAYLTYQCTINPLYSTTCVGYEAAYKNQQCTASPLYATDCPGYEQAYLNSQCIKDSLYSTRCEGYATAYAIKYLVPMDSTTSSAVNGALSDTAATKANDPSNTKVAVAAVSTTVNTDGTVSTGVSTTGDTNVDKAIAPKTSSPSGSQPAAAVQLNAPPPAAPAMAERKQENKQDEKKADNKPEGGQDKPAGGPQQAQGGDSGGSKPAAPTARQELQARREAAAKAEAVEKGKNLANEMGKASDMEAQKAVQNVVIQAMGFTPGFDAYGRQMIVQQQFYPPYTVYNNQRNIDNRANLRMFGGTDKLHNDMVESQYNRGK